MNFTLRGTANRIFPVGTTVSAYPVSSINLPSGTPPLALAADTQTMGVGELTFTGLNAGASYWAVGLVGSTYQWIYFVVDVAAVSGSGTGDVVGPASSTTTGIATFSGTTGKLIQDSGKTHSTDGTMASNSDAKIPTEKAVKIYSDTTKQPLDGELTALAALTSAASKIPYFTGSGTAALLTLDTDGTLAANSDTVVPTQKAVKTRTDANAAAMLLVVTNAQTANYTLVLTDAGKCVEMSNASARTITVPPNASVAFPTDTVIRFRRYGAGSLTLVAGAGVTINPTSPLTLRAQYSEASIQKRATNEWILSGDVG